MQDQFNFKLILVFSVLLMLPFYAKGQYAYSGREKKIVSVARGKAVRSVVFPVALGVGSTLLSDNDIVESVGSWLAVYGLVMGASAGNFYANDYVRGFIGAGVRLAGGYLMLDATREIFGDDLADVVGWDNKKVSLSDTRILIGSALVIGGILYSAISAKASVKEHNKQSAYLGIKPLYHNGKMIPMLTARFSF